MKVEIICWNTKGKISSNDGGFREVSESDESKYFYHLKKDIFKIIDTDRSQEYIYNHYLENVSSHLIFIVNEINKENLNLINTVILKNNFTIITGSVDLEEYDKNNIIKKVVLMPQLFYSEKTINIKSIILFIENIINEDKLEDYLLSSTIILGDKENKEPLGNIPLTILKSFNYMRDTRCLELNIYSGIEQSIQDLAYIKDPIMEYLTYDSMLKINQMVYDEINGKIYFALISK